MIATIPFNTTRPLFHIAEFYGADYTDVLNLSWMVKRFMRGQFDVPVWCRRSLVRYGNGEMFRLSEGAMVADKKSMRTDIVEFTVNFAKLQGSAINEPRPIRETGLQPGFEPGGNIWDV